MTSPELMHAWEEWCARRHPEMPGPEHGRPGWPGFAAVYPLYIGASPHTGTWYVRERLPGTRVWRAEEDGSFRLLDAFDMPARLAAGASLRGCSERDW